MNLISELYSLRINCSFYPGGTNGIGRLRLCFLGRLVSTKIIRGSLIDALIALISESTRGIELFI